MPSYFYVCIVFEKLTRTTTSQAHRRHLGNCLHKTTPWIPISKFHLLSGEQYHNLNAYNLQQNSPSCSTTRLVKPKRSVNEPTTTSPTQVPRLPDAPHFL